MMPKMILFFANTKNTKPYFGFGLAVQMRTVFLNVGFIREEVFGLKGPGPSDPQNTFHETEKIHKTLATQT